MVNYQKFQLDNGLRVIVHEDETTPMAVVNVLYDVGSRDEQAHKTGFAHLFEHLMFRGSVNVPDYDGALHMAGGECNAFTSSDMTNYYDHLPASNLETAFWLESDRMLSLNFNEAFLKAEKGVVCEEFKEHYINQPYGDAWHQLRDLSYQQHPYKWPVIGKELAHIEQVELKEVKDFFFRYYRPNNAILTVAGGVKADEVLEKAKKWFGDIAPSDLAARQISPEPKQEAFRKKTVEADVPVDALYMCFHICKRLDPEFYTVDLLSDLLASGNSSRLTQSLVKEKQLFSTLNATHSGSFDNGSLFVYGKLAPNVKIETAEAAIWEELERLKTEVVGERELEKVINKVASSIAFSDINIGNRAFYLAYFDLLGMVDAINNEMEKYIHITTDQLQTVAQSIFRKENCSTLYYLKKR